MIPKEQYEAAYKVGLRRHDGEFGLAEAASLLKGSGLRKATAAILAGNVSYLLKGEVYKRAISIPATDDYLAWISRDRGDSGLSRALKAVQAHIEYWEATHRGNRRGLRELLVKHRAYLSQPAPAAILMEWRDEDSSGYTDLLPLELLAREGKSLGVVLEVRGPRGGAYQAKCDLTVSGCQAIFDFEPYPHFNEQEGMYIGISQLTFSDFDRTKIKAVRWKERGKAAFKECRFLQQALDLPSAPPYDPRIALAGKKLRRTRDRPGQRAFRCLLKLVHEHRCCVTGCGIADILEAAHIDGYRGSRSDHICNGLLLRSDVHGLFDRHLISINPESLRVEVSNLARNEPEYARLHGTSVSVPLRPDQHPDRGALRRHWNRFCKISGRSSGDAASASA
jgi:hypothetical protein